MLLTRTKVWMNGWNGGANSRPMIGNTAVTTKKPERKVDAPVHDRKDYLNECAIKRV
jgi:hypothetical protein